MNRGSELYRRALAEATAHHRRSKTYSGKFLRPHKPFLSTLISQMDITSAIDVGCGKCAQYSWVDPDDGLTLEQAWGFPVAKYDPACPPYDPDPGGQYDLVICTHTLGSIPLSDIDWFVDDLFSRARKAVYIAEKIGRIKKNVHGERDGFINDWTTADWVALLRGRMDAKKSPVVCFVSTTEMIGGERITDRVALL